MPWQAATLSQAVESARAAFRARLPGADAWLEPNNVSVTARVIGGARFEAEQYLAWISRQIFVHQCDDSSLDAHGADLGLPRKSAAPASGEATLAASAAITVPEGARLIRADGAAFVVTRGASLAGPQTVTLGLVAGASGAAGNTLAGAALSLEGGNPAAVASLVVAAGGLGGGADPESDASYRERLLFFKRFRPLGGAVPDYWTWAREVPGVTRVFVERRPIGAGSVRVWPLFDATRANGIPTPADLEAVRLHLEAFAPSEANVIVAGAVAKPVNVTIVDLQPLDARVQVAIAEELAVTVFARARVAGVDPGHPAFNFLATPFSFSRSWIGQAVSIAAGEARHVLAAPVTDVACATGEIPVLGAVTYA